MEENLSLGREALGFTDEDIEDGPRRPPPNAPPKKSYARLFIIMVMVMLSIVSIRTLYYGGSPIPNVLGHGNGTNGTDSAVADAGAKDDDSDAHFHPLRSLHEYHESDEARNDTNFFPTINFAYQFPINPHKEQKHEFNAESSQFLSQGYSLLNVHVDAKMWSGTPVVTNIIVCGKYSSGNSIVTTVTVFKFNFEKHFVMVTFLPKDALQFSAENELFFNSTISEKLEPNLRFLVESGYRKHDLNGFCAHENVKNNFGNFIIIKAIEIKNDSSKVETSLKTVWEECGPVFITIYLTKAGMKECTVNASFKAEPLHTVTVNNANDMENIISTSHDAEPVTIESTRTKRETIPDVTNSPSTEDQVTIPTASNGSSTADNTEIETSRFKPENVVTVEATTLALENIADAPFDVETANLETVVYETQILESVTSVTPFSEVINIVTLKPGTVALKNAEALTTETVIENIDEGNDATYPPPVAEPVTVETVINNIEEGKYSTYPPPVAEPVTAETVINNIEEGNDATYPPPVAAPVTIETAINNTDEGNEYTHPLPVAEPVTVETAINESNNDTNVALIPEEVIDRNVSEGNGSFVDGTNATFVKNCGIGIKSFAIFHQYKSPYEFIKRMWLPAVVQMALLVGYIFFVGELYNIMEEFAVPSFYVFFIFDTLVMYVIFS